MSAPLPLPLWCEDWLTSESTGDRGGFLLEQEGAYIHLLAKCWLGVECSIPDDSEWLAKNSKLGRRWKRLGAKVRAKFTDHPTLPGRLTNEKLYGLWIGSGERHDQAVSAGRAGGRAASEKRQTRAEVERKSSGSTS